MDKKSLTKHLHQTDPETTKHRHGDFKLGLISLTGAFLVLTLIVKLEPLIPLDVAITRLVQSLQNPFFDSLMKAVSSMGNFWPEVLLPILGFLGLFWWGHKKEAVGLVISTYGAILISEIFKFLVQRPRPSSDLITQIGQYLKHDSFPSGHVLFYVGFFGYLLYLSYTKLTKNWLQRFLIGLFLLLIILVGISRIYLGAHWFSDVLGSYLIGSAWLLAMVQMAHRFKFLKEK